VISGARKAARSSMDALRRRVLRHVREMEATQLRDLRTCQIVLANKHGIDPSYPSPILKCTTLPM
jgi:hypothetical protein